MRKDEVEQMREQRKHLLAELKALAARSRKGGDWTPQDEERAEYLGRELRTISDTLHENHQQELEEIRSGRENGGYKAAGTGYERSFAPEPLYQAFRSAGFAARLRCQERDVHFSATKGTSWSRSSNP